MAVLLLTASSAHAEGELPSWWPFEEIDAKEGELEVIQNRKFAMDHELAILFGGLPEDPFSKSVTVTAGYTAHFSDSWAWEIAQFSYTVLQTNSSLKRQAELKAINPVFKEVDWFVTSRLVLKPIYGKEALFNTELVHLEVFLYAGPAIVFEGKANKTFRLGVDPGFGLRLWITPNISARVDIGELIYFARGVQASLHMHGGVSFSLGGDD